MDFFLFLLENIVAEDFFYIFVPEETNRVLEHSYRVICAHCREMDVVSSGENQDL